MDLGPDFPNSSAPIQIPKYSWDFHKCSTCWVASSFENLASYLSTLNWSRILPFSSLKTRLLQCTSTAFSMQGTTSANKPLRGGYYPLLYLGSCGTHFKDLIQYLLGSTEIFPPTSVGSESGPKCLAHDHTAVCGRARHQISYLLVQCLNHIISFTVK